MIIVIALGNNWIGGPRQQRLLGFDDECTDGAMSRMFDHIGHIGE